MRVRARITGSKQSSQRIRKHTQLSVKLRNKRGKKKKKKKNLAVEKIDPSHRDTHPPRRVTFSRNRVWAALGRRKIKIEIQSVRWRRKCESVLARTDGNVLSMAELDEVFLAVNDLERAVVLPLADIARREVSHTILRLEVRLTRQLVGLEVPSYQHTYAPCVNKSATVQQ
jgi:hypothetical protein